LRQIAIEYVVAFFAISALVVTRIVRSGRGTLHVHNPPDFFFPLLWLAHLRGWSTVYDLHDDPEGMLRDKIGHETRLAKVMAWLRNASAHAADLTITTNETQRALVSPHTDRSVVVRNAAPRWFTDYRPSPPNGRARLVYLGEIGKQDRVERTVDILANLVRKRGIDAELLIIGDGPERRGLEQIVVDQQLQDRVTITGIIPYERVPELLATAHVGLDTAALTEVNHGSTMVKIVEYLAVGLPVVASALRETKITGETAVITVAEDSVDAFTEPLAKLLSDLDAWNAAAKRARERGKDLQWDAQAATLIAAYQDLSHGSEPAIV
jgi:glycosyltransferase involved in cell wall biosynthesis